MRRASGRLRNVVLLEIELAKRAKEKKQRLAKVEGWYRNGVSV